MSLVKRIFYWLCQVLFWGSLVGLIKWSNSLDYDPKFDSIAYVVSRYVFLVFGIVISHSFRWLLLSLKWNKPQLLYLFPRLLILSVCGGVLLAVIFNIPLSLAGMTSVQDISVDAIISMMLFVVWFVGYYAIKFSFKTQEQEADNDQLRSEKNEIELQVLRSQLNPHFLFNSLNTVRALVDIDPELAKTGISRLAHLLRKSLISGKKNLITLQEEFEIVNEYIELEKIRFEDRVRVSINHDKDLDNVCIPPFIIQTLVENAMKHGITKLVDGGMITVTTSQSDASVFIRIENDGKLSLSTDTGVGLENTIRRLELEYKGKASFELYETPTTVVAEIEIRN